VSGSPGKVVALVWLVLALAVAMAALATAFVG
jgi:hypothetical protein